MVLKWLGIAGLTVCGARLMAETGYDAWLRYEAIEDTRVKRQYHSLPAVLVVLEDSPVVKSAQEELTRGIKGTLGRTLRTASWLPGESSIMLGTFHSMSNAMPTVGPVPPLSPGGYLLKTLKVDGHRCLVVTGPDDRGVLYGTFELLRRIGLRESVSPLDVRQNPYAPVRFVNHWDNMNGTIERGYAGQSIFWESNRIVADLGRVRDYGRLMASVGINGCSINNVNADSRVVTAEYLPQVARVAEAFRP
jgi:alpha-glucuronidase